MAKKETVSKTEARENRQQNIKALGEAIRSDAVSSQYEYERARMVYEKYKNRILKIKGVVGVDVGFKKIHDVPLPVFALRVFVTKKRSATGVDKKELIKPAYDGVPTDVIEMKGFTLAASKVKMGDGIRVPDSPLSNGTMGAYVKRMTDDSQSSGHLLLTAAHVAGATAGAIPAGRAVLNQSNDQIGETLGKKGVGWIYDSKTDLALVKPTHDPVMRPPIPMKMRPVTPIVPVSPGDQGSMVKKIGAKTKFTEGRIDGIGTYQSGSQVLVDHLLIVGTNSHGDEDGSAFADRTDSGALIVMSKNGAAIGLVRAVSDDAARTFTYGCQLFEGAVKLNIRLA